MRCPFADIRSGKEESLFGFEWLHVLQSIHWKIMLSHSSSVCIYIHSSTYKTDFELKWHEHWCNRHRHANTRSTHCWFALCIYLYIIFSNRGGNFHCYPHVNGYFYTSLQCGAREEWWVGGGCQLSSSVVQRRRNVSDSEDFASFCLNWNCVVVIPL